MLKKDRGISKEVEVEWNIWKTMDIFDGRLYHKVAVNKREEYNFSSMQ